MKYAPKHSMIESMQWTGDPLKEEDVAALRAFCPEASVVGTGIYAYLSIHSGDGWAKVNKGDFIIKAGENFYVAPDRLIQGLYEPRSLFLPDGYVENKNVPHFDDTSLKDEWQDEVYKRAAEIAAGTSCDTILDIGCGSAHKLRKYFDGKKHFVVGIDMPSTVVWLRKTYPDGTWFTDPANIPMVFDMVICSDVIEHVEDPHELIDTILSFRPGTIVISTPDADLLGRPMGPPRNPHHVREWTMPAFHALLSSRMKVLDHYISNHEQATQVAVCEPR